MSVRIDAITEDLRRTTGLPSSSTAFSICGWSKITRIANDFQYWGLEDPSNYLVIGYADNGANQFEISGTNGSSSFASSPTNETWFFWAMTCSGSGAGAFKGYWAYPTDTSFKTASTTGASFTPATLFLGNDTFGEYCNASYFAVKVWEAALTSDELWQEMESIRPHRYANLHIFSPLWDTSDLNDYSGNGKNWTGTGSISSEDNSPISYGSNNLVLPFVSSVVTTTTFRRTESDRIGSRS